MMQVREPPPPLPASVPFAARALIEAVLVKDPALRYATGGELALAVAAIRRGEPLPEPASMSGEMPLMTARSSTPTRGRPAVSLAGAAPAAAPEKDRRSRTPAKAVRRTATPATSLRTEPLRLRPKARSGRTLLLVLFVLLTMAAVTVGVFLFRALQSGGHQLSDPVPQGTSTGTVTGWVGILAGSAEAERALVPMIIR
jgi:eukaryotic-like serine/threonine-protein kinase